MRGGIEVKGIHDVAEAQWIGCRLVYVLTPTWRANQDDVVWVIAANGFNNRISVGRHDGCPICCWKGLITYFVNDVRVVAEIFRNDSKEFVSLLGVIGWDIMNMPVHYHIDTGVNRIFNGAACTLYHRFLIGHIAAPKVGRIGWTVVFNIHRQAYNFGTKKLGGVRNGFAFN